MSSLLVAFASILLSVTAQFLLKMGMSSAVVRAATAQPFGARALLAVLTNGFVFGGLAVYALGAVVWLSVLAKMDVSKAYPLVGAGFAITALIGIIVGEQVTVGRLTGIALICAGVAFVSRS